MPLFNEGATIPSLVSALGATADLRPELTWEFVLVNDGSSDQTASLLNEQAAIDKRFKIIHLSRNFGQQAALSAGLDHVHGDFVGIVDADLQDPPQLLVSMLDEVSSGANLVYGQRTERLGESAFKVWSARLFYRLLSRLTTITIPLDTGDFRVFDRKVLNAIRSMREHPRFLRGMFAWLGFRAKPFPYQRQPRALGHTNYSFRRMWKFALDAIFSFSDVPLLLISYVGFLVLCCGIVVLLYLFAQVAISARGLKLQEIMLAFLTITSGFQLLMLGILGHYVGQLFHTSKQRPLYLVQDSRNFAEPL